MKTETLYTVDEVAELLKVHVRTIRRWAEAGRVELVTLPGGKYRMTESELMRITQGKVKPRPVDWNELQEIPF